MVLADFLVPSLNWDVRLPDTVGVAIDDCMSPEGGPSGVQVFYITNCITSDSTRVPTCRTVSWGSSLR